MQDRAQSRDGALTTVGVKGLTKAPAHILADHSRYSRERLGDAIYGDWYENHCKSMRMGSAALLKRIEEARRA